ncbi:MAG TPA: ABC transporter substrate-binding protein [Candidatus Sulfotelmatobacter sp.]|nr:ABC transporter substrate-binding protein [Candidatus Sulfotelmatobacter sp.]
MKRRTFLKSLGAATGVGALAMPAIPSRAAPRTLRFIPHADLANFDPIWGGAYIARNAGLLVWDTLYGVDSALRPQRQMVEAEEASADGLTWTFRLRAGLKFHDGAPVLASDAVASINRWAARDPMGGMIKAVENELVALDDRTFRWRLKRPFPKMLLALGKIVSPCCFIMPARMAATDPFRQIGEYVGSGPMRFMRDEWSPGAKAAFEKFSGYVPRQEPASWLAGGKRMLVDRIEWLVIPDPTTASAALQDAEVDWWEMPLPDLLPVLRRDRNLVVDVADPLGMVGLLVMNHLFPPFDDVRARRAMLTAINQADYMHAYVGDDDSLWKPLPGYFPPGTPLYTEAGGDILKGPRHLDAAKRLLADGGYADAPVTVLAAQNMPHHKAWGDVMVDLLKRLDVTVDFGAIDWATLVSRVQVRSPPAQGGWNIFHTSLYAVDCATPANAFLRTKGALAANGFATSPTIEAAVAAWFDARTLDEEKLAVRRLNEVALDEVVYAPLGWYLRHFAWRKTVTGIAKGPAPFFWGVDIAA